MGPEVLSGTGGINFTGHTSTLTHALAHIYSSSRTPVAIGELVPELGRTEEFQGDTLSQHYFGNMMR